VSVVIAVTWSRISLRVAMLVDVMSIMVSIGAVAARDCDSGNRHEYAGGRLVNHHLRVPSGIFLGLAQDHRKGDEYVDIVREAA
jgi:hypothetical protein